MFDWFKRKRTPPPPVVPAPPFHDDVMGTLDWDADEDGWIAVVAYEPHGFRIIIGGDDLPDERLLAHAREIFIAPEKLIARIDALLKEAADELVDSADEIRGLHLDRVALRWPDEPDGGIIYFDGPDTDERLWQCDFKDRQPAGPLSYDD